MSGPRVVYKQHPGATPQSEISALAAIYRYLLFESSRTRQRAFEHAPEPVAATARRNLVRKVRRPQFEPVAVWEFGPVGELPKRAFESQQF
jgi:hypothetical protein